MNIGILSMQRVANFGSVLQAYSLKKMIESIPNMKCSFIDIEARPEDNILLESTKDYSAENGKTQFSKKIDRYILNRIINRIKFKKQISLINSFQAKYLKLDNKVNIYDTCVIGSDEVFNCLQPSEWGYTSQLFGKVNNATKVITYAASCGSTNVGDLSSDMKNSVKNALNNISMFSVRDNNTFRFVDELIQKKPVFNLDPVFVGDFREEMKYEKIEKKYKYCIIYSYYNRMHNKKEIDSILKFCKQKKMKLVSVYAPQYWISSYEIMTPFQLLNFFQNAEFVITDTFHGTIFSSKFSNRYGIIVRESNKNKLGDLIDRLEISNHVFDSNMDIEKIYNIYDDKKSINLKEDEEYSKTINYLESNLSM